MVKPAKGTRHTSRKDSLESGKISSRDLTKTKETLTLNALDGSFAAQEKKKLIEIFFGLDEKNLDEKTLLRRQTLTQLISIRVISPA